MGASLAEYGHPIKISKFVFWVTIGRGLLLNSPPRLEVYTECSMGINLCFYFFE